MLNGNGLESQEISDSQVKEPIITFIPWKNSSPQFPSSYSKILPALADQKSEHVEEKGLRSQSALSNVMRAALDQGAALLSEAEGDALSEVKYVLMKKDARANSLAVGEALSARKGDGSSAPSEIPAGGQSSGANGNQVVGGQLVSIATGSGSSVSVHFSSSDNKKKPEPIKKEEKIGFLISKSLPLLSGETFDIGNSDFRAIVKEGRAIVDKTLLIREVLEKPGQVKLITRPRRFGKTFNLSLLECFFDCSSKEQFKELFEQMHIWSIENGFYQIHHGHYPVIFLTLKDIAQGEFEEALPMFSQVLSDLYRKLQKKYRLEQTEEIEMIVKRRSDKAMLKNSLKRLTEYLYEACENTRVILLIDEYDTPIHAAYTRSKALGELEKEDSDYKKMINFIRDLFGAALKDNIFLFKAVLTGILRISKESIFSGLNNLIVYSVLEDDFGDCFGFTAEDVESQLKKVFGPQEGKAIFVSVNKWYGGYRIGHYNVFSPWSVTQFIEAYRKIGIRHNVIFKDYWINTSGNELIKNIIERWGPLVKPELIRLIDEQSIIRNINEHTVFGDIERDPNTLWGFLLFSGYLTIKMNPFLVQARELIIPNQELLQFYQSLTKNWSMQKKGMDRSWAIMSEGVRGGRAEISQIVIGEGAKIEVTASPGGVPEIINVGVGSEIHVMGEHLIVPAGLRHSKSMSDLDCAEIKDKADIVGRKSISVPNLSERSSQDLSPPPSSLFSELVAARQNASDPAQSKPSSALSEIPFPPLLSPGSESIFNQKKRYALDEEKDVSVSQSLQAIDLVHSVPVSSDKKQQVQQKNQIKVAKIAKRKLEDVEELLEETYQDSQPEYAAYLDKLKPYQQRRNNLIRADQNALEEFERELQALQKSLELVP